MVGRGWMSGASIEETLELWAASLREVKARMRPLFTQERVAASAGLFLDGLLGEERRKTGWVRAQDEGGRPPRREPAEPRRVTPPPGGSRRSWGVAAGMPTHCAILCARTWSRRLPNRMPSWWWTRQGS